MPLPERGIIMYAAGVQVGEALGGGRVPLIVEALPETGSAKYLYLVANGGTGTNLYDEYIWISDGTGGSYELMGQKEVDLSRYVTDTRKVGNVPLSADIPVSLTGDTAITVTNTGAASAIGYSVSHNDSGVTAGSKGDTAAQTPGFGGTFKALSATVDAKGHVTSLGDHNVTIPSATATSQANGLMSSSDKAKLDALSVTASNPLEVTKTGETYNVTLNDSGVTAGSKGDTAAQTPGFGGTFKALSATVDAKGRLTALSEHNVTVPNAEATTSAAGLMSAADKTKLDGIANQANKTVIDDTLSVAGGAADAKAAGDAIAALQSENALLRELINGIDASIYRTPPKGNPVVFTDGYAANVRKLSVTLTPTQSGTGDPSPSNVQPITGVSSVNVTRAGKNLFTGQTSYGYIKADGTFSGDQSARISDYIFVNGKAFVASVTPRDPNSGSETIRIGVYDKDKQFVKRVTSRQHAASFAVDDADAIYVRIGWFETAYPNGASNAMLELGTAATAYEAYQGQTLTVPLVDASNNNASLTVYGGVLDVTSGTLTVTHGNIASYDGETLPGVWLSDRDVYAADASPTTGAQVVYELATPVTYALTAQTLAALSGYNAVAANAGSVEVEYRSDTALVLEELTNAILSLGGNV